jgi:alkanesulfonate monooxygenase SsuD/methylene tetrahydromethanopterin reductase-like flavin-dependent oxidoreductase (luciferase family)
MTILPLMARVTKHLGLGATLSTTFHQPYQPGARSASLDTCSRTDAPAWNIVTSTHRLRSAKNFGMEKILPPRT